ncbi:hypothetical protein F4779DRAFT_573945 [Xylariaceae sp. FL0662B]|nr:hypothetical protein F4779DRAFT_573945 [Xylariaceae sp. FL0662B]
MDSSATRRMAIYSNVTVGVLMLVYAAIVDAIAIPPPTGPYNVGVSKHTIEHYNSHDPLAPNNISTAFLATIFYPTRQKPESAPQPYLSPETAAYCEAAWNYTPGVLESLTSSIQKEAPFLEIESPYPTILFGPGAGGPPVEGDTILLSELASYGYTVIGLDHPFEQPFVRFPNGTGVDGVYIDYSSLELIAAIYETRLVDNAAFLDYLPELVRKLKAPIDTTRIGAFGYSLGGAAAVGSMYSDDRIASGINLDGEFFGIAALNSSKADVKKPVFLLGNENHTSENEAYDVTWGTFPPWQTGYFRRMLVTGTTHHDFCDGTFWKTIDGSDPSTGPIDGNRQVKILNAYVKAFFDLTLLGQNSPILDKPSESWPEVVCYDGCKTT